MCGCLSCFPYWGPGLQPDLCPNQDLYWWPFSFQAGTQSTEPCQPGCNWVLIVVVLFFGQSFPQAGWWEPLRPPCLVCCYADAASTKPYSLGNKPTPAEITPTHSHTINSKWVSINNGLKWLRLLEQRNKYEMTNWKKNVFERVEGGELMIVGNWGKVKRESKIYLINKKGDQKGRRGQ